MFRFLPWRREGLSALLRLVLVVGLLEGVRSGYFAGLLPFYAPEHLGLGPAAFTLAFTLHQLAENLSKAAGGLLAERLGYGLTVTLAAATGLLALLLTPRADSAWILWTLGALWGLTFSSLYPGLMTLASRIARPGMDARALAFTLSLVMPWVGLGLVGVGQVAQRHPLQALYLLLAAQGLALLVALSLVRFRIPVPPPSRERYPLYRLLLFVPAAFGQTFAPGLVSSSSCASPRRSSASSPWPWGASSSWGAGRPSSSSPSRAAWWTGGATRRPSSSGFSSSPWSWPGSAPGPTPTSFPPPPSLGASGSASSSPGGTGFWPKTCPRRTGPPSGVAS